MYPSLLRKGDRGKHHNPNAQPAAYGQRAVASGVEGVELLEAYEKGEIMINSDGALMIALFAMQRERINC